MRWKSLLKMRSPVLRLVAVGILVAALAMALAPVALASGHLQAADGQSLNDQPTDVQALYRSVYGAGAAARWVEDHNAAIGEMGMDAPPPAAVTDVYLTVRHVAWLRSGDAELAARIAADVIARGTAEAFLAGTDTGVLWGVWTEPAPSRGSNGAAAASSSSTSSGPSTPTSPSTSTVSGWDDITRNYLIGQEVSLTLPSSSHPDVDRYALAGSLPAGLAFDGEGRKITGEPTTAATFSETYSAQDADGNVGAPYMLTLNINIRAADLQPDFRSRSQDPISILEGGTVTATLPEVLGGNAPIEYSVSGEPAGVMFTAASRELSGDPEMVGVFQVTYTAEDQDGDTASLNFTITVEADTEPVAPMVGNMVFTVGDMVALALPMGSGGNGELTHALAGQPAQLTFNPRTLWLSGTIADLEAGVQSFTWTVTYTVTDTGGEDVVTSEFTITVNKA